MREACLPSPCLAGELNLVGAAEGLWLIKDRFFSPSFWKIFRTHSAFVYMVARLRMATMHRPS